MRGYLMAHMYSHSTLLYPTLLYPTLLCSTLTNGMGLPDGPHAQQFYSTLFYSN